MGKNLQIDYQPTQLIYQLTIIQLLPRCLTVFLVIHRPSISPLLTHYLHLLAIDQVLTIYFVNYQQNVSKVSMQYQSEVLVNYKAMWADIPVHLDQYISQVSN